MSSSAPSKAIDNQLIKSVASCYFDGEEMVTGGAVRLTKGYQSTPEEMGLVGKYTVSVLSDFKESYSEELDEDTDLLITTMAQISAEDTKDLGSAGLKDPLTWEKLEREIELKWRETLYAFVVASEIKDRKLTFENYEKHRLIAVASAEDVKNDKEEIRRRFGDAKKADNGSEDGAKMNGDGTSNSEVEETDETGSESGENGIDTPSKSDTDSTAQSQNGDD